MKVALSSFNLSSLKVKVLVAAISAIILIITSAYILANKEITLKVDGHARQINTRVGTVADLLSEKGIKVAKKDEVKPSPDSLLVPGTVVTVRHARSVVLSVNGKRRKVWILAATVGQALESIGIDTSADIILKPAAKTKIASGMTINVKLLNRWIEKVQTEIAYGTARKDDSSLQKGTTHVVTKGKAGTEETVIEHVMAGGQEIEKIVRSKTIVAAPVEEVIKVGTRVPRTPIAAAPARGGRNMVMAASAYAAYTGGAGGRTATGTGVYKGIVAVDPRVIPLGTKLYIDGYGPAVAADTGGAIKGNRIDLGFATANEAMQFGRQTVTVRIVD